MKDDKDYIVDELLGLNNEEKNKDTIEDEQAKAIKESKNQEVVSIEDQKLLDPKSDTFINLVKENVSFCIDELKNVDEAMQKINNQRSSEMFFRKSENIKLLSQYMSKMASVNQKTLDLLILLLGAGNKINDDYATILETIDELGELNNGEAEVLNYLVKIKKMVNEIRDNDLKMKQVMEDNAITKSIVEHADDALKKEIEESQKARKLVDSKCNRLQRKITLNNIYIGICLILIVALAIFIGVKFNVF